jgi:hypothetical protein
MFFAAPTVALILFSPPPPAPRVRVPVFRHHPGLTDDNNEARNRDEKTILAALKQSEIGYEYSVGLGSGYTLVIEIADLQEWQKIVAKLQKTKSLKAYTDVQNDPKGFGLLSCESKEQAPTTVQPIAPKPREWKPLPIAPAPRQSVIDVDKEVKRILASKAPHHAAAGYARLFNTDPQTIRLLQLLSSDTIAIQAACWEQSRFTSGWPTHLKH